MYCKLFVILTSLLVAVVISLSCYYFRHEIYHEIYQYLGQVGSDVDVEEQPRAERIVDGRFAFISVYPYHIQYGKYCNGAIIHMYWVVTAAHCPNHTFIRVGSHYRDKGTPKAIRKRYVHDRFGYYMNGHNLEYDLQLLRLAKKLKWNDCVQPINISKRRYFRNTSWFTVTGFGDYYVDSPLSNVLQVIMVKKQKSTTCLGPRRLGYQRNASLNILCLGLKIGRHDVCMGDVGGPATFNNGLAAIVVWGRGCYYPEEKTVISQEVSTRQYSFYGTVSTFKKWIEKTTNVTNFVYV